MASTAYVSLICVAWRNTPLCACVPVFTMKILWVLNSRAGSLRSAVLWAEPGRGAVLPVCFPRTAAHAFSVDTDFRPGPSTVLPVCFPLTRACAERTLTSGRAHAPRGVHPASSAESTAPGLGSLSSSGLSRALSGPPASFSVSFGRCPSGTRQDART